MAPTPGPRLTIGQVATYAGVTTRAVRHYHQVGLLPEPARDPSGYRRYGASDVIGLIRIRALAEAGVPLARVGDLLGADRAELAAAVAEIDEQLRAEIERLERHREAVAQLVTIDGLALPEEVVAYLDHLRALGLSEQMVAVERDAWLLISAQVPDRVAGWIEGKQASFADPEVLACYRALDTALGWPPDDPRLDDVVARLDHLFARAEAEQGGRSPGHIDETTLALLDAESIGRSPTWRRLTELLEARGWTGWNDAGPPTRTAS